MSFRTIVEINHDMGDAIESQPDAFVRLLTSYIKGADPDLVERLERFGLKVVETAHHSTDREVRVEGRYYPL